MIKIFSEIRNSYDQMSLRKDLQAIYLWAGLNCSNLNCDKCKILSFFRNQTREYIFDSTINGQSLELVSNIKDLGVAY